MNYLEISRYLVLIASIIITLGLYDQTIKIYRTKSADDFTWSIVVALFVNEAAWINYGLSLSEWPIILVGILNLPAVVLMLIGLKKYKNAKK